MWFCALRLVLCLAWLGLLTPAQAQQVVIPETPAGHALADWLDAFNSGDPARMTDFSQRYQPTGPVDMDTAFRVRTGGFDLIGIRESESRRIEFIVQERATATQGIGRLMLSDSDSPAITHWFLKVLPPGAALIGFGIDSHTRARVLAQAIAQLRDLYVFPSTAAKIEGSLLRHHKHGDYDSVKDGAVFADLLTTQMRDIAHDKHLSVSFSPSKFPDEFPAPISTDIAQRRKALEKINCQFQKVEILPGNVGYLKLDGFVDPVDCGETAIAAMNFLRNADALIFDLRENGGGNPAMISLLCSYLFTIPTHLDDIWTLKSGIIAQYWTLPFLPGKRLTDVPVFVLTSSFTFSGGEEFAYDLQSLKRAKIVGEVTGGGAHPVQFHRIDDRFLINVPFARAINPITKTNWEGTGVQPDVKASAADALATAQKLAHAQPAENP